MKKSNRVLELAGLKHRSDLLTEGEDDLFGGDEEEEGGGDEEEADDEAEGDDPAEEEEEPPEKVSQDDIAKFGPGEIDSEIDSILKNIYDDAVNSAPVHAQTSIAYPGAQDIDVENVDEAISKYSMKNFLFEETTSTETTEEGDAAPEEFNINYFTSEVARYINNYETLLDMEGMLFNKARQFLLNQFGPDVEGDFVKQLALGHGLDFANTYGTEDEDPQIPIAVGGNAEAAPG